ncbi:unnamed protein product [Cladocopium goreaui]|uniref:2'-phosphotransferase n=1 Tax=Cladocopium goreaui TaxID=2562237 RepID=A0A9P1M6S4_9DINO|nr:unnamed protein product [Cladocopium goreaui]
MTPKVKPAVDLGLNTSQKNDKAAMAIISPVKEVATKYEGGNSYAWGVTWPGKCDKWGKDEAPIVDWDEVKQAFGMWKSFVPYNPFQYLGGFAAVMKEVASSKLPTKRPLRFLQTGPKAVCYAWARAADASRVVSCTSSSLEMPSEAEDAVSEASFQSADEEEDEDELNDFSENAGGASSSKDGGGQAAHDDDDDGEGGKRWNLKRDGDKGALEPIFNRLAEDREHVKISKMFSYVLRHAAHKLDVRIRKDGFVRLKDIMELKNFRPYTLEELMACVYFDEKERYTMVREFDGELLIRANQGHTMKVVEDDLLLEVITDPTTVSDCVHGTYLVHWPFIKRQGLSKVARNHIHLAPGLPEDGKIRGMRSTAELFLYIDVPAAMQDGMVFYRSKNEVILTQGLDGWLPVKYFIKAVKINYSTCDIEELEFDRNISMPSWAAELAPSGPGEAGSYTVKNLEALIAKCRKRMAEINELKAAAENGQTLSEEDQHKLDQYGAVYIELQSLEQRFRQHKGYRRESTQEKELRAKEEAEAATVVQRKDRAATPPWEKGKQSIESTTFKATDKEKAEWAALGKRRENAASFSEKPVKSEPDKDDPWAALGRGRLNSMNGQPATPSAEKATPKPAAGAGSESWRFGGKPEAAPAPKPASGPPRFFNSKLQQQKEQKEKEKGKAEAEKEQKKAEQSWRDRDSNWRSREEPKQEAAPKETPKAEAQMPAAPNMPQQQMSGGMAGLLLSLASQERDVPKQSSTTAMEA